ncbi:MAG: hypothetical protein E7293_08620 [Lachnospiraceae bacterium]|nr:hypothetical protein [Lachnospiraceae bacterium]
MNLKRIWKISLGVAALLCMIWWQDGAVQAQEDIQIKTGVYVGLTEGDKQLDLSGMTGEQARDAVAQYVEQLKGTKLTLVAGGGQEILVTAGELGLIWTNPDVIEDAVYLGTKGNVVQRYKMLKDLEHENQVFVIQLDVSKENIGTILTERGTKYDQEAVDMSLRREKDQFIVVDGQPGYALNVEESVSALYTYLEEKWDYQPVKLQLAVDVVEPRGTKEELEMVQDIMGSFSTSFATSNENRQANIRHAGELISGTLLYPGDEFSSIDTAGPFNTQNGYYKAGAFVNGRLVDSVGGGICQVTTTLYGAVLRAELDVTMRYNHSMMVSYVQPAEDAAIASSAGKDFKFVNNTEYPIYIEGYTTDKKELVFEIYGVEYRKPSRTVEYVPEILQIIAPGPDVITADATKPLGYIDVDSARTGYKSRLWKIVKEDGVEVSREQVNSSSYKMSSKTAIVGVATEDPNAHNEIMAAVGTGSIDHVKNVIAILTAPPVVEEQPMQ